MNISGKASELTATSKLSPNFHSNRIKVWPAAFCEVSPLTKSNNHDLTEPVAQGVRDGAKKMVKKTKTYGKQKTRDLASHFLNLSISPAKPGMQALFITF